MKKFEFDELIERAFCEGYEYAQKEFGREKIKPGSIYQLGAGYLDGSKKDSFLFDNKLPFCEDGLDIHSTISNNDIRSRYREALKGDVLNKKNISLLMKKYGIKPKK
jgi:hypothetical protein